MGFKSTYKVVYTSINLSCSLFSNTMGGGEGVGGGTSMA